MKNSKLARFSSCRTSIRSLLARVANDEKREREKLYIYRPTNGWKQSPGKGKKTKAGG